jgi:hypothetical protein
MARRMVGNSNCGRDRNKSPMENRAGHTVDAAKGVVDMGISCPGRKTCQLARISENIFFLGASALIFALPKTKGSLAQLVQSICLTSRGSAVRTRQLPHYRKGFQVIETFFLYYPLHKFAQVRSSNHCFLLFFCERVIIKYQTYSTFLIPSSNG